MPLYNVASKFVLKCVRLYLTAYFCQAGWPVVNRLKEGALRAWTCVSPDKPFSCSGQITKWTYKTSYSKPFRAIIFRPVTDSDTMFKIVGINDIAAGVVNKPVVYSVPEADRITVQEGDVIGWFFEEGVLLHDGGSSTIVRWVSGVDIATGQIVDINGGHGMREYSIEATVIGKRSYCYR